MGIVISPVGDQLSLRFGDGSHVFAVPLNNGTWIAPDGGGPTPGEGLFIWPFSTEFVTSEYMSVERPTHYGIDFAYAGIGGDPIPCAAAGTVVQAVTLHSGWGNYVQVETEGPDGETLLHLYAHMQAPPTYSVGDPISQGQSVGPVGQTGNSFGDHLHWETRINGVLQNPRDFMDIYG